jgi:hypothetical protein
MMSGTYGRPWATVVVAAVVLPGMLGAGCFVRPMGSRIVANETSAVASLIVMLAAQAVFHKTDHYGRGALVYANPTDGRGFPDLYEVNDTPLKLIDSMLAQATSPNSPKHGYYFVNITQSVDGAPYEPTIAFGACAVPAAYGSSGRNTFVIDVSGTVYVKDTGGKPVTKYPDVIGDKWIPYGS